MGLGIICLASQVAIGERDYYQCAGNAAINNSSISMVGAPAFVSSYCPTKPPTKVEEDPKNPFLFLRGPIVWKRLLLFKMGVILKVLTAAAATTTPRLLTTPGVSVFEAFCAGAFHLYNSSTPSFLHSIYAYPMRFISPFLKEDSLFGGGRREGGDI